MVIITDWSSYLVFQKSRHTLALMSLFMGNRLCKADIRDEGVEVADVQERDRLNFKMHWPLVSLV